MPSVWCYPCWLCLQSLPAQPHPLSHTGRLWANLFLKAGGISRQKSYPSVLTNPPPKLPQDLWICVSERLKEAQGNAGLSCLWDPASALYWVGCSGIQSQGCLFPIPLCFGGFLTAKEGVVIFLLVCVCYQPSSACLSVCLPVFIPLCLSIEPRVDLST